MKPEFTVQAKMQKPVAEVFDAVRNPTKLTQYFATGEASGPIEEGATLTWRFADHPDPAEVKVRKVVENEQIVFEWESNEGSYDTTVTISFEALSDSETMVSIHETGWRDTEKGMEGSYQNCEGWTQMLACLKAWLEHGVKLRQGYY